MADSQRETSTSTENGTQVAKEILDVKSAAKILGYLRLARFKHTDYEAAVLQRYWKNGRVGHGQGKVRREFRKRI